MKMPPPVPGSREAPLMYQTMGPSRRVLVIQDALVAGFYVPNGFQSDGASIPRVLWPFIGSPFNPESLDAAVVHDRLYQIGAVPREQADRAFRQLLRRGGVGPIRAWLMWVAVRWFGGRFYGRART